MKTLKIVSLVNAIISGFIVAYNIFFSEMDKALFIGLVVFVYFIWYSVSVYQHIQKEEETNKIK